MGDDQDAIDEANKVFERRRKSRVGVAIAIAAIPIYLALEAVVLVAEWAGARKRRGER